VAAARLYQRKWVLIKLPLALLALAVMALLWTRWLPLPPTQISISTALPEGMYQAWGNQYAAEFAKEGIELRVLPSDGAEQNLRRLRGLESPQVDLAFIQGGVGHPGSSATATVTATTPTAAAVTTAAAVRTLANVDIEPLWIFSRHAWLDSLQQMQGQRVSLGPAGSGTRKLALQLLDQVRLGPGQVIDEPLSGMQAAEALKAGALDTMFLVSTPEAPVVRMLLRAPGVYLVQLKRSAALIERLPFLQPRLLPQGALEADGSLPARDVALLTTTASLVARADLHPALQRLATRIAQKVHAGGGLFHRPGAFPSLKRVDFAASADARRTLVGGLPWLEEQLPFLPAQIALRLLVICLPVALVALWLAHMLPAYLRWLLESRVTRWYGELMYIEDEIAQDRLTGLQMTRHLERLDRMERSMASFVTPPYLMPRWYTLRDHIEFVRMSLYGKRGR
jgi:TRAP-type uncharacterized transport system substrate-binding protein